MNISKLRDFFLVLLLIFSWANVSAQFYVSNPSDLHVEPNTISNINLEKVIVKTNEEIVSCDAKKSKVSGVFYVVNNTDISGVSDANVELAESTSAVKESNPVEKVDDYIYKTETNKPKVRVVLNEKVKTVQRLIAEIKNNRFNLMNLKLRRLQSTSNISLVDNTYYIFNSKQNQVNDLQKIKSDFPFNCFSIESYITLTPTNKVNVDARKFLFFQGFSWNKPPPTKLVA
jgi:hypothetical protein